MTENDRIRTTGKNFGLALGAALAAACILTFIYTLMAMFLRWQTNEVEPAAFVAAAGKNVFRRFAGIAMCFGPFVFLPTFALLQRFRIRN